MPPVAELTNSQNRQREKRTPIVVSARGQTNAFRGECDLCRLLFPYLPYILSSYLISRHLCRLPKEKHIVLKPFLAHTFDIVHTIDYPNHLPAQRRQRRLPGPPAHTTTVEHDLFDARDNAITKIYIIRIVLNKLCQIILICHIHKSSDGVGNMSGQNRGTYRCASVRAGIF